MWDNSGYTTQIYVHIINKSTAVSVRKLLLRGHDDHNHNSYSRTRNGTVVVMESTGIDV